MANNSGKVAAAPSVRSNQERTQGQASKFSSPSGSKYNTGNIAKFTSSTKGTGTVGRPSSIGSSARNRQMAAVQNPSK